MSDPLPETEQPLDPVAAKLIGRVRRLMLISGLTTIVAVAAVFGIVGYRFLQVEGSATPPDVTAALPKGARVLGTAVAEDRIVLTIENAGTVELHVFDLKTLQPLGRLRLGSEP